MAVTVVSPSTLSEFAIDVRDGLSAPEQKTLSSKYFYDALGSALFEAICLLPEYGLTRAEARILERYADCIVANLPQNLTVVELGSGSGKKTRILLDAIRKKQEQTSGLQETSYHPIEISPMALERTECELRLLPGVRTLGIQHEYLDGLREVAAKRAPGENLFVLFLGSSIGNFSYNESLQFLSQIRSTLQSGDSFLLAADLIKPVEQLLAAYDDPTGVTAAFNLNLLSRINRELGGNFDLARFEHQALFNEQTHSIEMHLRSLDDQIVHIAALNTRFHFAAGETIWTETSHKYSLHELHSLARSSNFRFQSQWIDHQWPFAEHLWSVT